MLPCNYSSLLPTIPHQSSMFIHSVWPSSCHRQLVSSKNSILDIFYSNHFYLLFYCIYLQYSVLILLICFFLYFQAFAFLASWCSYNHFFLILLWSPTPLFKYCSLISHQEHEVCLYFSLKIGHVMPRQYLPWKLFPLNWEKDLHMYKMLLCSSFHLCS